MPSTTDRLELTCLGVGGAIDARFQYAVRGDGIEITGLLIDDGRGGWERADWLLRAMPEDQISEALAEHDAGRAGYDREMAA